MNNSRRINKSPRSPCISNPNPFTLSLSKRHTKLGPAQP